MKLLCLVPTLYNPIVLFAVTTFWVVVVLSSQDTLAFRYDSYRIPLNHGDVVVRTLLQFRGGDDGDLKLSDDDNDGHSDPITNIAGIQMDDSFRGGGQYQRQHYSTATTTPRTGGFIQRQNNLVGRLPRRFRDIRCTVNEAWSQVTQRCSLRVPRSNQNPRNTDTALLAVQVRGGADNDKKNQNHKVVNDSTKGIKSTAVDVFYSLLAVALGLSIAFSPDVSPDVSQDQYVGWHCLLAVALGFCLACSPFGNSRLVDVLVAATGG